MEGLIFSILRYVNDKILGVGNGQKCVKILKPFCENALTKRDIVYFYTCQLSRLRVENFDLTPAHACGPISHA